MRRQHDPLNPAQAPVAGILPVNTFIMGVAVRCREGLSVSLQTDIHHLYVPAAEIQTVKEEKKRKTDTIPFL